MTAKSDNNLNVFWFLPTHGDGRYLGTTQGGRPVDLPYLQQVAVAADSLGYYGVLIPTGKSCEDSWLVAAALAPQTPPEPAALKSVLGFSRLRLRHAWRRRWIACQKAVC